MKIPFKSTALAVALAGFACMPQVWADEDAPDTDATEVEVVEAASSVPGDRIAGYFGDFFGEEAETVAAGLRDGSIQYVEPAPEGTEGDTADTDTDATTDGDTSEGAPEVEEGAESNNGMGYGNVLITMALAEQLAGLSAENAAEGEMGLTASESLNEILRMRQVDGMGWGQIAKELGVNLGEVISGIRSNRPEKTAQLERREAREVARAEKRELREAARAERVAKVERPEKPARPEKPERPEKPQRPERPGK